jgi:two-component system OmpR family sensor kinase
MTRSARRRTDAGQAAPAEADPAPEEPDPARPRVGSWQVARHRGLVLALGAFLVCLLVAASVSVALLRSSMISGLDQQLAVAGDRYTELMADLSTDHDADEAFDRMLGPTEGALGATVADGQLEAVVVLDRRSSVPAPAAGRLRSLGALTGNRTVHLDGLGNYRVRVHQVTAGRFEVVGLPVKPVEQAIDRLMIAEAVLLVLLSAALAGTVGYFLRREATADRLREATADRRRPAPSDEAGLQALIAEASHELRTPAAVIHSYAELAEQSTPTLPSPVSRALQRIESESARMGRMVEDLLVLSRFESGYRPQLAEVDLTKLVFDAVDDARVTGRQDRWELITPDEPVEVLGNGRWLFQAITGLLANARAHTPPGTTVRLVLRRLAGTAELRVADDGPGIPPDILPTVFERFVRSSDEARYDGMAGTGLGLSVVRQIVQAHSGTITVDSSSAGTEFVMRLPLAGRPRGQQ